MLAHLKTFTKWVKNIGTFPWAIPWQKSNWLDGRTDGNAKIGCPRADAGLRADDTGRTT